MHVDFQIETGTQYVRANKIPGPCFLDGGFDNPRRGGELLADVDIGHVGADRERRDHHALDKLVRVLVQDVAVLECAGLRLIAIADQINRLGIVGWNEGPLHARWEARAAATAQTGVLHLLGDVLRRHADSLAQLLIAAVIEIAVDRRIITRAVDVLEDHPVFAGVWFFAGKVSDHDVRSKGRMLEKVRTAWGL